MPLRERHPGWFFPEPDPNSERTDDINNMAQLIATAIPCPQCGALVPLQFALKHITFHRDHPAPKAG